MDFFQCVVRKPVSSPRCFWRGHFNEVFPLFLPVLRKETSISNGLKTRRSGTNCSTQNTHVFPFPPKKEYFLSPQTVGSMKPKNQRKSARQHREAFRKLHNSLRPPYPGVIAESRLYKLLGLNSLPLPAQLEVPRINLPEGAKQCFSQDEVNIFNTPHVL